MQFQISFLGIATVLALLMNNEVFSLCVLLIWLVKGMVRFMGMMDRNGAFDERR